MSVASTTPTTDAPVVTHRRGRRSRFHTLTVVAACVGLAVTVGLVVGMSVSIRDGDNRYLGNQLRQVAAALDASVPAIQQPLVAGSRLARLGSAVGVPQFRAYEDAEVVGDQPLFRSVALFRVSAHGVVLVTAVGARPAILRRNAVAFLALRQIKPSTDLGVVGVINGPDRSLGFAERLPGPGSQNIVYAEDPLPDSQPKSFGPGSPFAGLSFALFQGRSTATANLIERDVALPLPAPQRSATVPYGSSVVTIVAVLTQRPPGVLDMQSVWFVGIGACVLTVLAAGTAEVLTRRREDAEQRYASMRGISETLQHSLLPPETPTFPGLELAGTYVAGVRQLGVGGDWYDAIPLDEDHVFLSVGDVAGKGSRAAQVMSSLRHAIRAYAVQGDEPVEVLAKLNDLVDVDRDDCFATVCCARVDVRARALEVASAGHLPPLLVDNGRARYVRVEVGIPAGLARGVPHPHPPSRLVVTPGSTLVFFTDGLVERRGRSVDHGLDALLAAASRTTGSVSAVATGLVQAVVPDGADDDLAILVVRWPEPVGPHADWATVPGSDPIGTNGALRAVRRSFPCREDSVELARRFVRDQLGDDDERCEVTVLLVSELASNAVVHGRSGFEVVLEQLATDHAIRVTVADSGTGRARPGRPWPDGPDGHGLQMVASLADRWGMAPETGEGTTVWFELDGTRSAVMAAGRHREEGSTI